MNERQPHPPSRKGWLGVVLFVFLLTACGVRTEPPATPASTPTATPTPPPTLTPTPTAIPGPFESQPAIPYPSDEIVQGLGITRYQVVDNHYVALDDEGDVVAQAMKDGEFTGWQRTVPFAIETNLVIPHPQETNPKLLDLKKSDAPIPQFVNAMKMAGIEVDPQEVIDNLQYQTITGADGKQYVIGSFNLDPDPNKKGETLEGKIPLMIWSEKEGWRNIFFPDALLFTKILKNIRTVIGVTGDEFFGWRNKTYIPKNFSAFTITYNFPYDTIERKDEDVKFRSNMVNELRPNNNILVIELNDLNDLTPKNFGSFEELMAEIVRRQEHAYNIFKQINNGNNIYVVLNEIHPGTPVYEFWKKYGDRFILETFKSAQQIIKEKSPNAQIIYNETYNYAKAYTFYPDTLRIVKLLKDANLIDGVGMQMHMNLNGNETEPNLQEMIEVMRSFEVPVYITEFDISQNHLNGGNKNLTQAKIAQLVVRACVQSGVCVDLGFFGTEDSYSWLGSANAHLFDKSGRPKGFFYAVLQALFEKLISSQQ